MNNKLINFDLTQQIMIQNLKDYIQQNALSLSDFANNNNLHLSNLSNTLNGKRKFSAKLAFELEDRLWLDRGYFTKIKDQSIKIPFVKIDNNSSSKLQFDDVYFSIAKYALPQTKDYQKLYAVRSDLIDSEPLYQDIYKSMILIFDSSELELIDNKIYIIEYMNHLILRKYCATTTAGFITDIPEIYAAINNVSIVKVLSRLVYTVDIKSV